MTPSPPTNDRSAANDCCWLLAGSPQACIQLPDWPAVTPPICRQTRRPLAHPDPLTLGLQQTDRLKRSVQNHQPHRSG
jgi:hypothetical protein